MPSKIAQEPPSKPQTTEAWIDEQRLALTALLEAWLADERLNFSREAIAKYLPQCSRIGLLRRIRHDPKLKQLYDEGLDAKIALAELDLIEAAAGSAEPLEKNRAFQAEFVVRAFSPRYIRRVESTGKDGGPVQVEFITASAAGE